MSKGWISLHRKIQDHWLYTEKRKFSKFEAWVDLLLIVNHEDSTFLLGKELIHVKRGQRVISIRQLCERWSWSNTKVQNFLKLLEEDGMISVKSDTKKTVITIENYDFYQSEQHTKTTQERHESDAEATQKHTNNNDNNENNDNKKKDKNRRKQPVYSDDSPYMKMANYLHDKILEWKPDYVFTGNKQTWADEFRKLHEIDNRSKQDIKDVIDWATSNSFWQTNILSPKKLRKQFDTLQGQMNNEKARRHLNGNKTPINSGYHAENKEHSSGIVINFGKYAGVGGKTGS